MVLSKLVILMVRLKFSRSNSNMELKGRFFRPFFYAILCCLPVVGYAQPDNKITFSLDSFNYSEVTSLHSIAGHWEDRITAGNEAISVTRMMFGYDDQLYSLQAIFRDDTYYRFNNETAQFVFLTENRLPLENGYDYKLEIKPDKVTSKGLRLGFSKLFNQKIKLSGFFSLLKASNIIQGSLNGHAQAIGINDYDFNFSSDLVYQEDPLFERKTGGISGKGYSIDLIVDYTLNENWRFNLKLLDVMGELSFDNVAYTTAEATSDTKVFDEHGYLTYDPVISGIEGYKDYVYKFDMQTHLSVAYQLSNRNSLIFQYHRLFDFEYQKLVYRQQIGSYQLSWSLLPRLKAAGLNFKHPNFSIGLETDNSDYKKMKYLAFNTQFFWTF